ncbi:hypothetical protein EMCRGX_G014751 [Ephydatia muelleri]
MSGDTIVYRLHGSEVTRDYFERTAFCSPVLVEQPEGLGFVVPPNITVSNIERFIGPTREFDVLDVASQTEIRMTLMEWTEYFLSQDRKRVLNALSLEYTDTEPEKVIAAPTAVREMDWIRLYWPKDLPEDPCYQKPKFGKYCLMSTKGSFTDFHVDIAGTSVWHYVYSGEKFFYLIPPTNENINKLTSWSSHNDFSFLSDHVPECYVVHLTAGNSLFMPSVKLFLSKCLHVKKRNERNDVRNTFQVRDDVLESARASYMADPEKKQTAEREGYHADPEKKRSAKRERYHADPEKKRSAERKGYHADPEKKRSAKRERYHADPEKKRSAKRERYHANPEKKRSAERKRYWEGPECARLAELAKRVRYGKAKRTLQNQRGHRKRTTDKVIQSYSLYEPKDIVLSEYKSGLEKAILKNSTLLVQLNDAFCKTHPWLAQKLGAIPVDLNGRCVVAKEIGDRHLIRMRPLKWKCTNECRLLTSGEMEAVLGTKLLFQKNMEDLRASLDNLDSGCGYVHHDVTLKL